MPKIMGMLARTDGYSFTVEFDREGDADENLFGDWCYVTFKITKAVVFPPSP